MHQRQSLHGICTNKHLLLDKFENINNLAAVLILLSFYLFPVDYFSEISDSSYSFSDWVSHSEVEVEFFIYIVVFVVVVVKVQSNVNFLLFSVNRSHSNYISNMSFCFQSQDDITVCPQYTSIQHFLL